MELEKQVCSLESAKRLKELGVRQDSLFYWQVRAYARPTETPRVVYRSDRTYRGVICHHSAFTASEIGMMLPAHSENPERFEDGAWWCNSQCSWGGCVSHKSEAEARAKNLIYLIENELVEVVR